MINQAKMVLDRYLKNLQNIENAQNPLEEEDKEEVGESDGEGENEESEDEEEFKRQIRPPPGVMGQGGGHIHAHGRAVGQSHQPSATSGPFAYGNQQITKEMLEEKFLKGVEQKEKQFDMMEKSLKTEEDK